MSVRQPRLSKEEHARLGADIYEQRVRPQVESGNHGRIVAIDVDTGEFEVADDTLTAAERLLARLPDAQIWFVRIGHRGVHRFGLFDVYSAEVLWDGRRRPVEIQPADTQPLAGMDLLHRYSLYIDVVAGGRVEIDAMP